ncbi:MAG: YitT family protein [Prevotellaceae bacterium]|nr:YitT family protein [Candidatus Minthosoma equi]
MTKSYIIHEIKDYALIAVGVILYALGVTVFMLPYGLTTGGVAGISSIVYYVTGLEVQVTYIAINVCFLLVAVKVLGIRFCLKTIYAVFLMTFVLWLLQRIVEVPDPTNPNQMMLPKLIGEEAHFMACVLGAIICGIGLTFCFENNGSTGGTDIIAAIVNKYKTMSLGTVIMACDVVIISSCYFIFHDWFRVIYGFVMLFICSLTLDYCIRRQHQSVQFMIFSRNYQKLADAINDTGHGVTILEGEGWYTKSERKVIVSIVRKRDSNVIFRMIKSIDPYAFVSMSEAQGVYGESFDKMKVSDAKGENRLKKTIIVRAIDDRALVDEAQAMLGDDYDVRSLLDVGCDVSKPFNAQILTENALRRASFVKKYYGFDAFAIDPEDGHIVYVQGDYDAPEYDIHHFNSLEEMKQFLSGKKKA